MTESSNLKFTIDGVEYTWYGGFGAVFQSREFVKLGSVRKIGKRIYHAYMLDRRTIWKPPIVSWSLNAEKIQVENIREIRNEIFGL